MTLTKESAELIRSLFACCRKMQRCLHMINGYTLYLTEVANDITDETTKNVVDNIVGETRYIYDGQEGFPDVAQTLMECRDNLKANGEWKEFSDYVGFYKKGKTE